MAPIPARAADRVRAALKQFQPVLASAKSRDVNESDTVVIVTDMLQAVFGYDKYSEITSEHAIRGTFCDLAVKLEGKLAFLLEVKAIGIELKDQHVKQAVDYAANQGVEWVGLTNGTVWRMYRVQFSKPIENEQVIELDFSQLSARSNEHIELVGLLSRECWLKSRMAEYYEQRQALNRFTLGALILSDAVVDVVRRELRRVVEVKVEAEEVRAVLQNEVLKREVLEGDKAAAATRRVSRAEGRSIRKAREGESTAAEPSSDLAAVAPVGS
ncbi:MAG: restriction endonuclease subunit R [Gammaproteobacteria bacterium]